jgi:hypothetical protein
MNASPVYIEIASEQLRALYGEAGLEVPLDRQPDGRLTDACKEKVSLSLRGFLRRQSWQPRLRALCAIGARGVSLRCLTLPAAVAEEEFHRLLLLQVESEFPLPPSELAWGYRRLEGPQPDNGPGGKQQLLVAAVKKEVIEDYAALLRACGLNPGFTLAALARNGLCPPAREPYAILELAGAHSELISFENGTPSSLRVLFGGENGSPDSLAEALGRHWTGAKLYLSGGNFHDKELATGLEKRLGGGVKCELLETGTGEGRSSAILGLKRLAGQNGGSLLFLQTEPSEAAVRLARPALRKWTARAAALAVALCLWPYAEALLLKPALARKLSALKADTGRLATIDRELEFLQYLKQNQPPYLDALFVCSKVAPQGAHVDSFSLNRRGEVSLRGYTRDAQQVVDFRSKLMDSGFFSSVAIEEQVPTPDRQKVNMRLSAQWKPAEARALLKLGPSPEEIEKVRTNKAAEASGPTPPGALPFPKP